MKKELALLAASAAFVGCFPSGDTNELVGFNAELIVPAVSADYATADVVLIGSTRDESDLVVEGQIATTNPSDIRASFFGDSVYRIGRFGFDNITEYSWNSLALTLVSNWQYSVAGDDSNANPADILVVDSTTAYVSRTGANALWVVNPSASTESDFKTAEIDLSAFANATSGKPFMADLEIVGNTLFVMLTGLDDDFTARSNSKVVAIDTLTNEIIDTDPATDGTQAIDLPVNNAADLVLVGDTFYIAGTGDYFATDYKYTGGIATLDANDYSTALILDDGDAQSMPYGNITRLAAKSNGDVYFVGYTSFSDNQLYFLENGETTPTEISVGDAAAYNLSALLINGDNLYVGVHGQFDGSDVAGLKVISTATNTVVKTIETTFNPTQIILAQ